MDYANLGRSGLKVSRVCLGTNAFGAGYVDDDRAITVINEALSRGINFIDTADVYHDGLSEQVVGRAVKGRRHEFVVATKGFMPTGPGVNERGLSRKHLIDAVEGSLRRLGTDYIDLYQVHYWDQETPLEETLGTLDGLVRQGKIRYIGCSNHAAWQLARALWISDKMALERYESVQPEFNFRTRELEGELFGLCEDQQVSVVPYQVLMAGVLTGQYGRNREAPANSHMAARHSSGARTKHWNESTFDLVDSLKAIATEAGYEPAQIVLAWVLSKPAVTSVIVGTTRPEQVAMNVEASTIELPAEVLEKLNNL
jgi:aryl-alcohol dehydrogenase-like predicted oxidoreductase